VNGEHRQRTLDGGEASGTGVSGLQVHAGQAIVDGAHPGTAISLQVHTQQPELAERQGHLCREGAGLVPGGDVGPDGVVNQPPDALLDGPLLVIEQVVDDEKLQWSDRSWCHGNPPETERVVARDFSPLRSRWRAHNRDPHQSAVRLAPSHLQTAPDQVDSLAHPDQAKAPA
jgi:hypothetical protein